ncbi:UNC93-like protein, partial [Penaeus indicus]|uniref:UNC93-like protein n=1 Tax=Penaeus indicus TaxID=29960 RepID=UPI00300D8515
MGILRVAAPGTPAGVPQVDVLEFDSNRRSKWTSDAQQTPTEAHGPAMSSVGVSNPAFEGDISQSKQTKNETVRYDHNEAKSNSAGNGLTVEQEKFAILKNVIVISVAFMFLFTSYNSMSFLQSSINKVEGTASLTVLYAAFIFSCCFLPTWMIKRLQEKYTIAACMLCYSTYMAAQFYPRIYTLVPTAVVVGLGAAPMWSAKCTYLAK